jgi:hypothetical protein
MILVIGATRAVVLGTSDGRFLSWEGGDGGRELCGGREVGRRHRKRKGPVTPGWKLDSIYRTLPLEAEESREAGDRWVRAGGGFGSSKGGFLGVVAKHQRPSSAICQATLRRRDACNSCFSFFF